MGIITRIEVCKKKIITYFKNPHPISSYLSFVWEKQSRLSRLEERTKKCRVNKGSIHSHVNKCGKVQNAKTIWIDLKIKQSWSNGLQEMNKEKDSTILVKWGLVGHGNATDLGTRENWQYNHWQVHCWQTGCNHHSIKAATISIKTVVSGILLMDGEEHVRLFKFQDSTNQSGNGCNDDGNKCDTNNGPEINQIITY